MLSEASHCINFLEVWGEGNDLVRKNRYHLKKLPINLPEKFNLPMYGLNGPRISIMYKKWRLECAVKLLGFLSFYSHNLELFCLSNILNDGYRLKMVFCEFLTQLCQKILLRLSFTLLQFSVCCFVMLADEVCSFLTQKQ